MLQTVTTMASLLLSAGAGGVIAVSLWEDRQALRRALAGTHDGAAQPLPAHTQRVAPPRRARFIQLEPVATSLRAAA